VTGSEVHGNAIAAIKRGEFLDC